MRTIAVIPARAGSRGIPSKNLRLVGGRTLVARTVELARVEASIDRVLVSTDSPRIATAARRSGAETPFIRPAHLATDVAATVDVVRHAVEWVERETGHVDLVVTLQPTSPFCRPETLRLVLAALDDPAVDSATTVADVGIPVSVVGTIEDDRFVRLAPTPTDVRRQATASLVRITGAVYVTRRGLLEERRLLGDRPAAIVTRGAEALDIDDAADLAAARRAHRQLAATRS
jgi:CMP-N-acetylneuraminic acid synthetase